VRANNDINLEVMPGQIVGLIGPNGAGKTTTLLTFAGVLPVIKGEVDVLGSSIKGKRIHQIVRRGLALVPEDRGLFFQLTVAENLRLGYRKGSDITIDDTLHYFPALAPLQERRCGLLSGGEQQMLGVARALIAGPKVLMIDEMSLGLAPIIVERLLPVMRQIADEHHMGILLVEQHVHMALAVADRAYVLSHGELSMQGDVAHLRAHREILEASYLGDAALPAPPKKSIIEQLRDVSLFAECSDEVRDLVARIMTELPFRAGEALIEQGSRADTFMILVEGEAEVLRDGERVATVGPGGYFGEVGILQHQHRNATVRALTDVWVLVGDHGQFNQLLDDVPGLADTVKTAAGSRQKDS
jgi:branched-chain amino acid transport system ATP-binding protein